jgi:rRNA maturation protein Nop10
MDKGSFVKLRLCSNCERLDLRSESYMVCPACGVDYGVTPPDPIIVREVYKQSRWAIWPKFAYYETPDGQRLDRV